MTSKRSPFRNLLLLLWKIYYIRVTTWNLLSLRDLIFRDLQNLLFISVRKMTSNVLTFRGLADEVYTSLKLLRASPKAFARVVKKCLKNYKEHNLYYRTGHVPLVTTEGKSAARSLRSELRHMESLPKLSRSRGLFQAAQHIVNLISQDLALADIPVLKIISENGCWYGGIYLLVDEGGISGNEVALSLLLDDGLEVKSNKLALLSGEVKKIGVGAAPCSKKDAGTVVVILLATDFQEGSNKETPGNIVGASEEPLPSHVELDEWKENAVRVSCELTHRNIGDKSSIRVKQQWELRDDSVVVDEKIIE